MMGAPALAQWFIYMIEASDGRLYTGITTDVERRFREHADSKKGARFFRGRKPGRLVYVEDAQDRSRASQREAAIKALSRREKLALIEAAGVNPD